MVTFGRDEPDSGPLHVRPRRWWMCLMKQGLGSAGPLKAAVEEEW
jgi:hypothetical protein